MPRICGWRQRTSTEEPFSNVTNLGSGVNSADNDVPGSLSADGLTLYFASNRTGNADLYQATRASLDAEFGNVESLGDGVNTDLIENAPRVLPDGLTMVYHQAGLADAADHDIWIATRSDAESQFSNARRLEMNLDASDWWPSLSSDGRFLFTSDWTFEPPRPGGEGQQDIWVSYRTSLDTPFMAPVNWTSSWPGSELNSNERSGAVYISPDWPADGSRIYYVSSGPGPTFTGISDIFQATWHAIPEPTSASILRVAVRDLPLCRRLQRRL